MLFRSKRDFVQSFENKHSISYFKSNFSIPIELTQHSNSGSSHSGPYVLGYCGPRNSFPKTYENNTMYAALNQYFEKVFLGIYQWNHFEAPVIYFSPTNGFSRFFCYQVTDVKLSAEFWTHLFRFRIKQSSYPHWAVLEFSSPIQSWSFEFMLVQTSEKSKQSNLDDSGFTCLALLCTDLETHLLEYRQ